MAGNKIPSRLNTSFIYKVKNSKNKFTADIADGARSAVIPKNSSLGPWIPWRKF